MNREKSNFNSTPTHGFSLAHSLSNSDGKSYGGSTLTIHGGQNSKVLNGNGSRYDGCRTDSDSKNLRTTGLSTGMDGILGSGDSPNVCANGIGVGVGTMRLEGKMVELVDKILDCKETEGICEDQSTLTVSFSIRSNERRRCGCYEMRYA